MMLILTLYFSKFFRLFECLWCLLRIDLTVVRNHWRLSVDIIGCQDTYYVIKIFTVEKFFGTRLMFLYIRMKMPSTSLVDSWRYLLYLLYLFLFLFFPLSCESAFPLTVSTVTLSEKYFVGDFRSHPSYFVVTYVDETCK